ncbi:hypothetical protein DXA96_07040 [Lachnospiraceae bacterium OF09-33XD]|nr:hypothetical protein DXA96_07040 [Lachnospiraceae bacterium OF09-33XD]
MTICYIYVSFIISKIKKKEGKIMKLTMNANYLNRESKPGIKDPNKINYTVLFMQGTDTVTLYTTEQVFNNLEIVPPMTECKVSLDYNSQYRSLRLMDVQPIKK